MWRFETEQDVCEVGGVKFGGQPGQYPTVVCSSIFQKGDRIFEGKRKEGFDESKAEALLNAQDRLWEGEEFRCPPERLPLVQDFRS